uniref:Uncharacterized protein n=1 Tax=Stomoxys calcitrans TaxID=35570 RepID=A0A1I8PM60_STOCA
MGRYLANISLMLNHTIVKDADAHLLVYFNPIKRVKAFKFLDFKMNICDVLSQAITVPIVKVLMDEMRRTSNLPFSCPIKGNFLYSVANYRIDASTLPPYVPIVPFNYSLSFYKNDEKVMGIFVAGATVPKN